MESALPATPPPSDDKKALETRVIDEALKKCFDPEIPVNVWDLGLIYSVDVSPERHVTVQMTLTAPACPVAGSLPGEVEAKVKMVEGVREFPIRVKCATLSWHALEAALKNEIAATTE